MPGGNVEAMRVAVVDLVTVRPELAGPVRSIERSPPSAGAVDGAPRRGRSASLTVTVARGRRAQTSSARRVPGWRGDVADQPHRRSPARRRPTR